MGKVTQSFVNNVPLERVTATIPLNGSTTGTVVCTKYQLLGVHIPASFTGTSITFACSFNNEAAFNPVCQKGTATAYSITVSPGRYIPVDSDLFRGVEFLRLTSGSIEVAARDIICILGPSS
jgi:hypothetical protein